MFIELHARSAFSFLEGASVPEELAAVCAELGMPAMALLDHNGVYGAPRFHMAAQKSGIKAHIGAEVTVQNQNPPQRHRDTKTSFQISNLQFPNRGRRSPETGNLKRETVRLPLLPQSRTGYQNLC